MHKLFEFIRSVYVVVLFVILEAAAISYYAHSSYYTQARLLSRSNQVIGGVHGIFAGIRHYFSLGRENRQLLERVAQLEGELARYEEAGMQARLASYQPQKGEAKYFYTTAAVAANTVNRTRNLITINRGRKDGLNEEMGILSPEGAMAGYILDCSENYSVAMSVLNTSFRASGKLADTDYYGSIYWDGVDQHVVIMDELSKYAEPQPGQEVITAGFSNHFPPDIVIGYIESATLNETQTAYTVRVRLAAEMSRLNEVVVVDNRDLPEIKQLQQSKKIEQHIRHK